MFSGYNQLNCKQSQQTQSFGNIKTDAGNENCLKSNYGDNLWWWVLYICGNVCVCFYIINFDSAVCTWGTNDGNNEQFNSKSGINYKHSNKRIMFAVDVIATSLLIGVMLGKKKIKGNWTSNVRDLSSDEKNTIFLSTRKEMH